MGIDNFSNFIKNHAPNCYFEVSLESFRGKCLAIDINNLVFMMMSTAVKEITDQTDLSKGKPDIGEIHRLALDKIVGRLTLFMKYGVTPVSVFDSKPHPLKSHAKQKRKAQNERLRAKLVEAETNLYSVDSFFRNQGLISEYNKYYKQNVEVSYEFMAQVKELLDMIGFPTFLASDFNLITNDAEAICALLCINNYCVATLSTDSDYHAYGGNLEAIDMYPKYRVENGIRRNVHYLKIRSLEAILLQSRLPFEQFRDLCILMGTDFNSNIRGIGPKKSWDYIMRYRSIEALSHDIDVSILNYDNVLKIFSSSLVQVNIPQPTFNVEQFREHGRSICDLYGLRDHVSTIAESLNVEKTLTG